MSALATPVMIFRHTSTLTVHMFNVTKGVPIKDVYDCKPSLNCSSCGNSIKLFHFYEQLDFIDMYGKLNAKDCSPYTEQEKRDVMCNTCHIIMNTPFIHHT